MSAQISTTAATATTASSNVIRPRQRMAQNYLLIWLDSNIDETNKDCENTLTQLQSVVNDVNIFTQLDQGIDFLTDVQGINAFMIIAGTISQQIIPLIHDIPQLDTIYIYCRNKSTHEQWTKNWIKVKGEHTDITGICKSLQQDMKQCNENAISMSFVAVNEEASKRNLNQLDPTFMYTQIFKEILLDIEHSQQSIKDLASYCRKLYEDNASQLNIINQFERDYRPQSSIWWYTRECFTYQMLNRALRTLEADTIINMGFYLSDLHRQIEGLHKTQVGDYHGKSFLVYRGQGLSNADFEKLLKSKGGLMSFNNFLSTSKNREVPLRFAKSASTKADTVGILFQMCINPSVKSAPFASIEEISYYKTEEEILFSMHTVFCIGEIKQMDNNRSFYQIELTLTSDDDPQLRTLTDLIRKEAASTTGWGRLGLLLIKIGQFNKAEELYNVLLEQTSDVSEKAVYYNQLGCVKSDQGDYDKAIWYNEKALAIFEEALPPNHPLLATSYGNIGMVYKNMGEYLKALSFLEKDIEIREKILPSNNPSLATSYNNIGLLYDSMGEYSQALPFYEKALEIFEKTLPSNHPLLASSYNNIGGMYDGMGEYSKAFSFYEKSLEIDEKILPPNHPDLAQSYNNIGFLYNNMGEYSKALSFYEKALTIFVKVFPTNHPSLATSYNNIGVVYYKMGQYSKALSFYQKALEIRQKTLPRNHPDLAQSYNSVGMVNYNMGNYSKALSYFEPALNIYQTSLPSHHPIIQDVRKSIEVVKKQM